MLDKKTAQKEAAMRLGARIKELIEASEYSVPSIAKHFGR